MRGLTTFARHLVRSVLVVCVMSLGAPCAAQEVDVPTYVLTWAMDVARYSCPGAF